MFSTSVMAGKAHAGTRYSSQVMVGSMCIFEDAHLDQTLLFFGLQTRKWWPTALPPVTGNVSVERVISMLTFNPLNSASRVASKNTVVWVGGGFIHRLSDL